MNSLNDVKMIFYETTASKKKKGGDELPQL